MAKEKYIRNLEHVNIGTMGHVDHGKTTLSAAITAVSATQGYSEKKSYDQIDNAPEEKQRGITINSSVVEFSTRNRHYALIDCPGHADYIKNAITGMNQTDYLILVVAATDGVMAQTKEHLLLSKQIGMTPDKLLVFLNKVDALDGDENDKEELRTLVEEEVREDINRVFGDGADEKVTIISGSALAALDEGNANHAGAVEKIKQLHDALDSLPLPTRDTEKPFLMSIEDVFSISGRGTVATGRIDQGVIKVGEEVEVVSARKGKFKTTVTGIEMFRKELEDGKAGENVGMLLRGVGKTDIQRGDVICKPNTITPSKKFRAEVYVLKKEEGGRHTSFGIKYRPQFYVRTADITGDIKSIKDSEGADREIVMPGDNVMMDIELLNKIAINKGLKFSMREGGRTVGAGIVTEVL
ncbi:MAG: elongation factor Tu [Bacteroidota bacterium]